jgi:hypothetical protein
MCLDAASRSKHCDITCVCVCVFVWLYAGVPAQPLLAAASSQDKIYTGGAAFAPGLSLCVILLVIVRHYLLPGLSLSLSCRRLKVCREPVNSKCMIGCIVQWLPCDIMWLMVDAPTVRLSNL